MKLIKKSAAAVGLIPARKPEVVSGIKSAVSATNLVGELGEECLNVRKYEREYSNTIDFNTVVWSYISVRMRNTHKGALQDYLGAIGDLLNRVASMTFGVYEKVTFSGRSVNEFVSKKKFETNVTREGLVDFNQQFEIYLQKLRKVSGCIFNNILNVVFDRDPKGIEAEDFYKVFYRMNNDQKIFIFVVFIAWMIK
ncbi:hypothetical protein [Borrelia persica]|uniref:hypothetical protein n=1 Tax=Borrelia persica TaxID=44448 RepID=UPI0004AD8444|nr:hypothetical protein [Borrelia persica]